MHGAIWFGVSLALATPPAETIVASWNDGHGLVRYQEEVRSEVETILEKAGVRVHWSDTGGEPPPGAALPVSIVVSPSEPEGEGWHLSPSAMGVYFASPESSAVFVFYSRVARVLGVASERDGIILPAERKRLAKALGRVVVHELVHRVAPDLPHADAGIMRSDLGRSLLLQSRLELDEGTRSALLAGLRTSNHLSPGPRAK